MTSKSPLQNLPSIGELLKHPRVQVLVERVNQSTVAARAADFFAEMRANLLERGSDFEIPSLSHLAERFARHVLGDAVAGGPWINAAGVVTGNPDVSTPMAEEAVHAMLRVAGEFGGRREDCQRDVTQLLCRLARAESACVVSSFQGALLLAVTALAGGREFVVEGADAANSSVDWQMLAARGGAVLRTEASQDGVPRFRAPEAISESCLSSAADPQTQVAAREAAYWIDAAPLAGLINPGEYGWSDVQTISERLDEGADVVVCDGSGLLGGPPCGLCIGSQRTIESIVGNGLGHFLTPDVLTLTALHATLQQYQQSERIRFSVPVWQLLSTPIDNLELRAKRIAPLIRQCEAVRSAEPVKLESTWAMSGSARLTGPSWAVQLLPTGGSAETLAAQLRRRRILTTIDSESVLLDLRTVQPRWDQQLATTIQSASC